ncbi:hypothetical protein E6O75_ATG04628 [Venturia nashicola]|uniref:Uncharacterized protein n=1 Tax=Venturia nashicola TaxID=86259 RepID=A0A4Z1P1D5_9PEZI|nr:hypothetical protein E6O75_ATG04628 [Venturia nashicola]
MAALVLVEKAAPLDAVLLEAMLDTSIRRRLLEELERDGCEDSGGGKTALGGGSMLGLVADDICCSRWSWMFDEPSYPAIVPSRDYVLHKALHNLTAGTYTYLCTLSVQT